MKSDGNARNGIPLTYPGPKAAPQHADVAGTAANKSHHMDYAMHKLGERAYTDNPTQGGRFLYRGKSEIYTTVTLCRE